LSPPVRFGVARWASPLGEIVLVHDDVGRLRVLDFGDYDTRMHRQLRLHYGRVELVPKAAPDHITTPLGAYFKGDLDALDAIRVETGGTVFQRSVWSALRDIPSGKTTTYGALATAINAPKAVRAVGLANGANPIAIVVPCHRVIGANGSLTGFGGGLHRKQWLLEHEGAHVSEDQLILC